MIEYYKEALKLLFPIGTIVGNNGYEESLFKELEKFIDFARKQLPNYVFNYKVIDKRNVEIDCIHISENMLKCKTIHYTKGDGNIPLNDYSAYITWIEDGRDERYI